MLRLFALLAWLAAVLLGTAPLLIGADSGGVLPWTQWAAATLCLTAIGLTIPECLIRRQPGAWQRHMLAILLLLLAGYGFLQAAPLPSGMVTSVAPGSAAAYSAWLSPLARVPEDAQLLENTRPRISVDATLTRSAAWLSVLVAGFAWLASYLFIDRSRLRFLLTVLAITGAIHAGLGIYQLLTAADATVWGIRSYHGGKPFGAFINRSNATVMLNLGLAGSLGLIAWRLAALTGTPLNGERFPYNELLDVAFDRLSVLAFCTASVSLVGLLICGSRSGLVGLVGGLMLAFGMVQSANKLRGLLATAVGLGLMVAIVMVNLDLSALSADRLGATANSMFESAEIEDARLTHWRDGFAAAIHQPATGWGWGAYRFAYLPFQKTSSGAWFVNADNLWLELFVETGLVGIALLAVGLWVIIRALSILALSVDPIDHGLVIAGWFALGALTTSQFFDFGLRIPANSIMAAILFSAVIARSDAAGAPDIATHSRRTFRFASQRTRLSALERRPPGYTRPIHITLLVVCFVCVLASANALAWQARGDQAIRMARSPARDNRADIQAAETIAASLAAHLALSPADSAVLTELSRLQFDLARVQSAQKLSESTKTQSLEQILRTLSRSNLRQKWYSESPPDFTSEPPPAAPAIHVPLQQQRRELSTTARTARKHAIAALIASPLSPEARFAALTLDFAGGDPQQSAELLQQAAMLRSRNPEIMLHVGDLAAEAGDLSFAASSWKRAIYLNTHYTAKVLRRLPSSTALRPDDVIPQTPDALRTAASIEIKHRSPDTALLSRALETFVQSQTKHTPPTPDNSLLISKIQHKLNRTADALQTLQQATIQHPRNITLRLEYASSLLHTGHLTEAHREATAGHQIAPDDERFEKLLQTIAQNIESKAD